MCWLCLIGHQSGGQQTQSNQRKVSDQGDVWRGMENKEGFSRQMRGRVLQEEETACRGGRIAVIVALQHLCCCRWHLKWDDGWEMVWGGGDEGPWKEACRFPHLGSGVADHGNVCLGRLCPWAPGPNDKMRSTSTEQGVWKSLLLLCPVWCVFGFVLASWPLVNWRVAASQSYPIVTRLPSCPFSEGPQCHCPSVWLGCFCSWEASSLTHPLIPDSLCSESHRPCGLDVDSNLSTRPRMLSSVHTRLNISSLVAFAV